MEQGASNGVIIITTRKGRQAQTLVNYNSYVSMENVARRIHMMSATQLKAYLARNNLALDPSDDQGANTDWQDAVTQTAVSMNHHVSLSGGSNNLTYDAAVNYFDSKGILKNTGLSRLIGPGRHRATRPEQPPEAGHVRQHLHQQFRPACRIRASFCTICCAISLPCP